MKAILLTLFALAAALPQAIAQEADLTRATVNVGEGRLESLLTDAQKQAVKHLTVTGTLADEDYAYLRSGLLAQLDTLDLRRADIDTIPKLAFYSYPKKELRIILPEQLKHLSDSSLWFRHFTEATYVLTGKYPTIGNDVYSWNSEDPGNDIRLSRMAVSESNVYCTMKDGYIVSADSTVVYRSDNLILLNIPEGVILINERAFENNIVADYAVIPSTVDSIGDCAFANLCHFGTADGWPFSLSCLATVPPRLGKEVFTHFPGGVYVPDESLELYLDADGWKDVVVGCLGDVPTRQSIKFAEVSTQARVRIAGSTCRIVSDKTMAAVRCYSTDGKLLGRLSCNAEEAALPLNAPNALIIVKVDYADGTNETIKLKP